MDDNREERGKPCDLGYVRVSYRGYVHSHMVPGWSGKEWKGRRMRIKERPKGTRGEGEGDNIL